MGILLFLMVLLILLGFAVAVFVAIMHWRFLQTPEKAWKDNVSASLSLGYQFQHRLSNAITNIDSEWLREKSARYDQLFGQMLSTIGVDELESYPGIGPATVSRLWESGYSNVGKLRGAYLSIPGIGDKRISDINYAIRELVARAKQRFDRSECAEAKQYLSLVAQGEKKAQSSKEAARAELDAVNRVLPEIRRRDELTQPVTFWNYLINWGDLSVPDSDMEIPIPDVASVVKDAASKHASRPKPEQRPPVAVPVPIVQAAKPVNSDLTPPPSGATPPLYVAVEKPPQPTLVPVTPSARVPKPVLVEVSEPKSTSRHSPPQPPVAPNYQTIPTTQSGKQASPQATPGEKAQLILDLTIQFAFVVARCDGHLAKKERDWIECHFSQRYSRDPVLFNRAMALCAHYETAALDVDECLKRINDQFTAGHKSALLELAKAIAAAAGDINQKEQKFLDKMCQKLGIAALPAQQAATSNTGRSANGTAPIPNRMDMGFSTLAASASKQWQPDSKPMQPFPSASPPELAAVGGRQKPEPVDSKPPQSRELLLAALEIDPATPLSADLVRRSYLRLTEKLSPEKFQSLGVGVLEAVKKQRQDVENAANILIAQWKEELVPKNQPAAAKDLRHNPILDDLFGA